MTATSYGTGLIGTQTLTDLLGTLERVEGFGEGNHTLFQNTPGAIYDDSGRQGSGRPTLGYGFNITVSNTLLAVLPTYRMQLIRMYSWQGRPPLSRAVTSSCRSPTS